VRSERQFIIGNAYANVLPEPVGDIAMIVSLGIEGDNDMLISVPLFMFSSMLLC